MKNQKADFALELDDMSDKMSDWDDKPKDKDKKKEKSPKSAKSSKKKKKELSEKSDDYNDNWDMSASYNELQLEDKGEQKKQTEIKKAAQVPVTNVNFGEIPTAKEKEQELKIDFWG